MNDGDVATRLRAEIGQLTRLPASEFVAARTSRAKELKADGDTELARELAAQRRPTVPAWAADQLAHRHADELEGLFDAADRVRATQVAAAPDRTAVREASTAFTAQVRRLRGLAGDRLAEAGTKPDAHLDEVEATLLAAATDEPIAAALRAGALLRPAPSPGFAALASLSSPGRPAPRPAPDELRAIEARREELRTRHETCVAEARRAAERAAAASSRAEELRAEAERLRHDAAVAEAEARDAEKDAEEAREAAAELTAQLAALGRREAEVTATT